MRESPVASENIAVDQASRRPVAPCSTRPSIGSWLVVFVSARRAISARNRHSSVRFSRNRIAVGWWVRGAPTGGSVERADANPLLASQPPARRGLFSDAEHQAAEEARPDRGPGTARQSALPLYDEDAGASPPRGGRRPR